MIGGVCVNTGTIPSKTLREAVLHLTGFSQRELYGSSYRVKRDITVSDLSARTQHVIGREIEVVRAQLFRNHVELVAGSARFVDPHTIAGTTAVAVEGELSAEELTAADLVVVHTDHSAYDPEQIVRHSQKVFDTRNLTAGHQATHVVRL